MLKAPDDLSTLFCGERPDPWTLRISDPLPLGGDPAVTANAIACLRDATARFTRVLWSARLVDTIEFGELVHLHPPTIAEGPAEPLRTWRDNYRYASFYYRLGPTFITVKDARDMSQAARFVIDDENICELFLRCATPVHESELTDSQRDTAGQLLDEGLLLDLTGWLVTAPSRMIRWPIPGFEA